MKGGVAAALLSFTLTLALVPLIRHLCQHRRIFDQPGALKIHAKPIPRLGGVAIFCGVFVGLLASNFHDFAAHWQFFAAMSAVWTAGLIDDLRGLPPTVRLCAQLLSAVLLWRGGWHTPLPVTTPIQLLLLCLLVVLFVNSFNFLDGSDGLTAGVSVVTAVVYLALPWSTLTPLGFAAALCIIAACCGFLPFNWYPASIFLGDSGSTLLGFLAAFIALEFANATAKPKYSIILAIAIAALPIFDALRVIVKRIARGASPVSGDRNHFYDGLLTKGWTPKAVAIESWLIVASCGAIVVCIARLRASVAWSSPAFLIVAAWIKFAASSRPKTFTRHCDELKAGSD